MERQSSNSIPADTGGPFRTISANVPRKVVSAWGITNGTNECPASGDASLFSSSLPVLPHEKLNFTDSENFGQSVGEDLHNLNKPNEEDGGKHAVEDIGPNGIGSLLPDDADELLAGIMDDFDLSGLPTQLEDLEDDLFGSVGGMEMDFESQESLTIGMSNLILSDGVLGNGIGHYGLPNGVGTVAGEHPYGEHPSRTLFVRNINSNVEDSELRSLFEQYGDIRTLYTACKHRGFVMISYYDIRAARTAMRALQNKPLRRRKLDIHFSIPKDNPSEKDINQGTLVVFNLDASVSNDDLRQIFGAYGEVKEQYGDIRTLYTACKHRGFVMISYYDIRAARTAMRALQNKPLRRRKLDIHFSIPKDNPSEKDINQGTLVVFNLDASVSNDDLRQIFGAYGEVKEIRETPHKRHHKFIEFYDVRAAEAALKSLNRSDIAGKRIKLEPSRPGGARRNLMQQISQELEQDEIRTLRHPVGSPVTNSPPGKSIWMLIMLYTI
ncbi:unnamed protein product [Ilex paraguariensis]|uniref:RRM domain-containing protein n=1 Tax=Ilex paraguariensis TaxID=185542 RepID=A0ABC8UBY9_9AQUA